MNKIEFLAAAGAIAAVLSLIWVIIFGGRGFVDFVSFLFRTSSNPKLAKISESKQFKERLSSTKLRLSRISVSPNQYINSPLPLGKNIDLNAVYVEARAQVADESKTSKLVVSPQTGLLIRIEESTGSLLEEVLKSRCVVVLGDGGSGKTTFVSKLFVQCAKGQVPSGSVHASKLPLYCSCLNLLNFICSAQDGLDSLNLAKGRLETYLYIEIFGNEPEAYQIEGLKSELSQGRFILLLDGLDDIVGLTARSWLVRVLERMADDYPNLSIVITCRPASYTGDAIAAPPFQRIALASLSLIEIQKYVNRYRLALSPERQTNSEYEAWADNRSVKLIHEINSSQEITNVAQNPRGLAILCYQAFVQDRATVELLDFLDSYSLTLAGRWSSSKQLATRNFQSASAVSEDQSPQYRRALLELIAFRLSESDFRPQGEDILIDLLEEAYPSLKGHDGDRSVTDLSAQEVIRSFSVYGGVLNETGDLQYRFQSKLLNCYLAARYIFRINTPVELEKYLIPSGERSSNILIASFIVGLVSKNKPEHLGSFLKKIVGELSQHDNIASLVEYIEIIFRETEFFSLNDADRKEIQKQLAVAIFDPSICLKIRNRLAASAALRGFYKVSSRFVSVNAGSEIVGRKDQPNTAPVHKVLLSAYEILNVPITVSQFAEFVSDGGYEREEFWTAAGWKWRLERKIVQPFFWDVPQLSVPLFPVVGVSWFEANAYSRWASARLPTEIEWEHAAAGTANRDFPWGSSRDTSRLNSVESDLQSPSVVGILTDQSQSQLLDMVGNVWEWTSSKFAPYPYQNDDGREDLLGEDPRILKGGSWFNSLDECRSFNRRWLHPGARQANFGFRLAHSAEVKDGS